MSVSRRLGFLVGVCLVVGLTALVGGKASADVSTCQQAYVQMRYTYDDPANVPDGAYYNGAATADVTSGSDAGQPGCESFTDPLLVRRSTLTSDHVTSSVVFIYSSMDNTADTHCTGVISQPDGGNGVVEPAIMDPTPNSQPETDGAYAMYGEIPFSAEMLSALVTDEPTSLPVTIVCDNVVISRSAVTINALSSPTDTAVSLSKATSKTASSTLSGRLMAGKAGHRHPLAATTVTIQHKTSAGWVRVAKVRTTRTGHYGLILRDSHPLRAKYHATLRYWGSQSKVR